jgi:hypothetical protein
MRAVDPQLELIAFHEAGYIIGGRAAGVEVSARTDLGLRRCWSQVVGPQLKGLEAEDFEGRAFVLLTGNAALERHAPGASAPRDLVESREFLFRASLRRFGGPLEPSQWRELQILHGQLSTDARTLVNGRWAEIQAEAGRLMGAKNRAAS